MQTRCCCFRFVLASDVGLMFMLDWYWHLLFSPDYLQGRFHELATVTKTSTEDQPRRGSTRSTLFLCSDQGHGGSRHARPSSQVQGGDEAVGGDQASALSDCQPTSGVSSRCRAIHFRGRWCSGEVETTSVGVTQSSTATCSSCGSPG